MKVPPPPVRALRETAKPFFEFLATSRYFDKQGGASINDLVFGNPHDMPLPELVASLRERAQPEDELWFGYKVSEPVATEHVAQTLNKETGIAYRPADVAMTTGAFGALAAALRALSRPDDEVIYFSPPWFFYEMLIAAAGARPRALPLHAPRFEPDLDSLRATINERTRAVIWNHPHNPSGRVYPPETLAELARVLKQESARLGRPIYLLADEAYRKIVFDGREFHSVAGHYDDTLVIYTYGKTLLAPGQRVGYIALPPGMHDRDAIREDIETAQFALGFAFPNALMQYALRDLERLSIDIDRLQRRRDRLSGELHKLGYSLVKPEGTFYMLVAAPRRDDRGFAAALAERDTFVLPGSVAELPGWVRLSLTASDEMVERSLPVFSELRG